VYAPYVANYPPDTAAASLWLRNRQPEKWRDRQNLDVRITEVERRKAMTPEQRARADEVIE
jgi:hypothetical protein